MEEITLYDSEGSAVAYISDDDNTIYLWSGEPVAYTDADNVYGFNGKHLGWFEEGIVWNHSGERAGFIATTLPVFAKFESFKAFKQFKPFRAFQQFAPFKPFKSMTISKTKLSQFLMEGVVC